MSGVTYYKLSKGLYPGDVTKDCGLTGPEIDANFNFLRGYDIASGDLNPENGVITLHRLNGDKIEIEGLAELLSGLTYFNLDESYYDPSNGTLHLFVNGVEQSAITGFFTYADIHTDCTLEGDGSEEKPLKIAKEFVEGIDAEIKDAVGKEKEEREEADRNLNEKIEEESHRATEAEAALAEAFGRALNEEAQARQREDDNISQRITEEITSEKRRATEAEENLQHEISAITDNINELEEKVADVTLTKDVVISESSPLYSFISGIWEDNIIPSGTTFTDFVEKLCSGDTRMIYYIDTPLSDIDDVVENFDNLKSAITIGNIVSFKGTMGAHIVGVALPKPHNLLSVISTQNGFTQRVTDKFFVNPTRDVISEGVVYTLYYYKINVGLRSSDNFTITLS